MNGAVINLNGPSHIRPEHSIALIHQQVHPLYHTLMGQLVTAINAGDRPLCQELRTRIDNLDNNPQVEI